jgi:hypothetical protein
MTDVSTPTGGIAVTPDILRAKVEDIAKLDEQLDAASGSEAAGKRALGNALAKEYENAWKGNADNLVEAIQKISDPQQLAGVYTGIISSLQDSFRTQIDEYLTKEVEARSENREQVDPAQIQEWTEARKVLMEQYKALRNILEMFEQDISGIPEPKKRTGARGKRGKRVLQGFDWFIDDEPRTEHQNSMSSIANTVCAPLGWKTADLRSFLEENGVDLQNPEDEFSIMLPDPVNKKLSWKRRPVSLDEDPEEDDDDDDDIDDDDDNGVE